MSVFSDTLAHYIEHKNIKVFSKKENNRFRRQQMQTIIFY